MGGWAPRALEDSVRPPRLADVGARPLNVTVTRHHRPCATREVSVISRQFGAPGSSSGLRKAPARRDLSRAT